MAIRHDVLHYYRLFRGNMKCTAEQAYWSARRHIHFRQRLAKMVKPSRGAASAAHRSPWGHSAPPEKESTMLAYRTNPTMPKKPHQADATDRVDIESAPLHQPCAMTRPIPVKVAPEPLPPLDIPADVLSGPKRGIVRFLLCRPGGCTLRDIKRGTGWKAISIPREAASLNLSLVKDRTPGNPNRYFGRPLDGGPVS
jgi:hypothetical protein